MTARAMLAALLAVLLLAGCGGGDDDEHDVSLLPTCSGSRACQ